MIAPAARAALAAALGEAARFDVPGASLTALRVGGPVDALVTPPDRAALARTLALCARHRLPVRAVGRGFNLIVRDEGASGVLVSLRRMQRLEERPGGALRAEAGVSHASVAAFCRARGLAGLEFTAGIPGSVGGWLAMNAGIGEREMRDVVREVEVMSPAGRRVSHLPRERLRFVYRALRGLAPGSLLLSALLAVRPCARERVRAEMERHLAKRAETQPLDVPSFGSVWRNPPGAHAGALLDAAGMKGVRVGGAEISRVHANFIVNRGDARSADVLALMERARERVRARCGVRLEPEVQILGREP